jgi:hypothetical protein
MIVEPTLREPIFLVGCSGLGLGERKFGDTEYHICCAWRRLLLEEVDEICQDPCHVVEDWRKGLVVRVLRVPPAKGADN